MSKKVITMMIVNIIIIGIFTVLYFVLKDMMSNIPHQTASIVSNVVLTIIYFAADIIVILFFLFYWWADVKWTKIQKWARKKFRR